LYPLDGSFVVSEKHINGFNNNEIWLYKIVNGGHDWPGSSGNRDIDTSTEIWKFFNKFIDSTATLNEEMVNRVPEIITLYQNYPNPFNPITTIRYKIPQRSLVNLSIFNSIGQYVATLVLEEQSAGIYNVVWDAKGFASGVYLYRLETGQGYAATKKLLIVK